MPTQTPHPLMPTSWLAEKLNLSVSTVERMRSHRPDQLPPHVAIGRTIRYDAQVVEAWLQQKIAPPLHSEGTPQ